MSQTPLEISSTEITLFIYHQGVEAAAHFRIPVRPPQLHLRLPKVDGRQSTGRLASPVLMQQREASAVTCKDL